MTPTNHPRAHWPSASSVTVTPAVNGIRSGVQHLDPGQAPGYLRSWCYGAKRSRLQPIKNFVKLVETHWDGIVGWHDSRISNGLLEGTNSLIQAAKARARGYRSKTKMITIIYLIAGKLPNPSPYVAHPI